MPVDQRLDLVKQHPKQALSNPRLPPRRCHRPDSQFRAAAMGREGRPDAADSAVASREAFQPRGREHAFTLNSLAS